MTSSTTAKAISLFVLGILGISSMITFAADPSFSITPVSTGLKLHCNYVMGVMINPGLLGYNGFENHIKFDSGNVQINHISINPLLPLGFSGYIKNGFLYKSEGGSSTPLNGVLQAATFGFKTLNNITNTTLEFTNRLGTALTFGLNTTDDGAVINSSINGYDILTGITNATYTFSPLPCILDNEAPLLSGNYPSNNATGIPASAVISFILYDWAGAGMVAGASPMGTNNRSHYRYSGLDTSNLNNYQPVPVSNTVDNQEGVNSGSIRVSLSCPTCVGGSWPYTLTASNMNIATWMGTSTINRYTRDSVDRGYTFSFPAPAPYEIEKLVTVSLSGRDNPNENGVVHTGSYSFSFNAPVAPTITRLIPTGSINIDTKINPLVFVFSDTWAGINPATISITIPQFSSGSIFYTGYTYSGSDLTITLTGGSVGTGNAGSYQVSLSPKRDFPSNTNIRITGSVYDYANNHGGYDQTFRTKMSCADWGCSDVFTLNILGGIYMGMTPFTGGLIVITGTNLSSPYPYLTGVNNDTLMCGRAYTGAILTGNIGIYDTTGVQINGAIYTGDILYITGMDGLDFVLSGGVVIIQ